jgi:hypothetical protein
MIWGNVLGLFHRNVWEFCATGIVKQSRHLRLNMWPMGLEKGQGSIRKFCRSAVHITAMLNENRNYIVTWRLKFETVEPEEISTARQRLIKQVTAARIRKQQWRNCWERCFLFTPCSVVIIEGRYSSERVPQINAPPTDSNKNLVVSPRWVLYSKIDWPTNCRL